MYDNGLAFILCCRPSTFSKKCISNVSWPIVIKFHLEHSNQPQPRDKLLPQTCSWNNFKNLLKSRGPQLIYLVRSNV